jgi:prepilin-type N-terminal cleavage/methylation domain-containing protein
MKELSNFFKKIKNNKGFTLIELLAVIVVLAIVLIIAVPAIGRVIENSRRQAYLNNEKMMEKAARSYMIKNLTLLPKEIGDKNTVLLSDLVKANVIENIKDPKDKDNNCDGYVEIKKVSDDKYNYNPYLKCGENYETVGLIDGIITTISKVTDGNPGTLSGGGTQGNPYLIESIEDLVAIGLSIDSGGQVYKGKYIKLNVDLDFKDNNSYVNPNTTVFGDINENGTLEGLKIELTTELGFNPIGDYGDFISFNGAFDGNNKIIRNLYINRSDTAGVGLFAVFQMGQIKNVSLININVTGLERVGGLAGKVDESNISNSRVTGNIKGAEMQGYRIGGLLGEVTGTGIENVYTTANVTGNVMIGGIIGYVYSAGIKDSYATGDISGHDLTGGLIGVASNIMIVNCYATGNIIGRDNAGGLTGILSSRSSIENSYATGNIKGRYSVGGLVGAVWDTNTISNSYAIGDVTGTTLVGSFVGNVDREEIGEYLTVENSYATGDVTGINDNSGEYYLEAVDHFIGGFIAETVFDNLYYYSGHTCTNCEGKEITGITSVNASNLGKSSWHTGTLGWNSQWSLTNGKYPLLYKKGTTTLIGGQTLINTPQ